MDLKEKRKSRIILGVSLLAILIAQVLNQNNQFPDFAIGLVWGIGLAGLIVFLKFTLKLRKAK